MKITELYHKVDDFDAKLSPEFREKMLCQKGCSKCCYTDLSVFSVEAVHILSWFEALTLEEQNDLLRKWSAPLKESIDFAGHASSACPFLFEEVCTIYEARPLICRTQGLAMKFVQEEQTYIDVCPLNEDALSIATSKEMLNLDLLNLILAELEREESAGVPRERVRLRDLRESLQKGRT